jgi:hypothetical protein
MRGRALILVACLTASASAAPRKSSESFSGYGGLQLRAPIAKTKNFARKWLRVAGDDQASTHYALSSAAPAFQGVQVDKAIVVVSRRMHVVVAFALTMSGPRCAAMETALDKAWGPSEPIGGLNHAIEWPSARVDASLERAGPDRCMLFVGDRDWDDTTDQYRKRQP